MIPTGLAEWGGLAGAFSRLFPGNAFEVLPSEQEMDADRDRYPLDGFTSNPLREHHEQSPPESAMELVSRAAGVAVGAGRARSPRADLVVILDDLELANAQQPARVIAVMRAAVTKHLGGLDSRFQASTATALRERVSFHLAAPMVESWFFGDPAGLDRACASARHTTNANRFDDLSDPEDFTVHDPDYAAATEAACPEWVRRGRKKDQRPRWLSPGVQRDRHPKAYLQWLCLDGTSPKGTGYKESVHGVAALRALDWSGLLARDASHLAYLRSLIADVADVVGQPPATGVQTGKPAALTSHQTGTTGRVLRNL